MQRITTAMLVNVECESLMLLHRNEVAKSASSSYYYMWSVNQCDTSTLQSNCQKCKLMSLSCLNSQNMLPDHVLHDVLILRSTPTCCLTMCCMMFAF